MMRWSRALLNTLREAPQDAEIVSHKLMIRAGMLRKLGGGLYTYMPLGLRALQKIERIVEILNEDDKGEKHAGNHYQ